MGKNNLAKPDADDKAAENYLGFPWWEFTFHHFYYRLCHEFRLTKRDDYFKVSFKHF
jgi:hypothetical protein